MLRAMSRRSTHETRNQVCASLNSFGSTFCRTYVLSERDIIFKLDDHGVKTEPVTTQGSVPGRLGKCSDGIKYMTFKNSDPMASSSDL
uniref:DUF3700 domain-containing protein n=1 Tax=Steinernema glaseri TaxID=37863 RepID=A0A1I8ATV1_9BILA